MRARGLQKYKFIDQLSIRQPLGDLDLWFGGLKPFLQRVTGKPSQNSFRAPLAGKLFCIASFLVFRKCWDDPLVVGWRLSTKGTSIGWQPWLPIIYKSPNLRCVLGTPNDKMVSFRDPVGPPQKNKQTKQQKHNNNTRNGSMLGAKWPQT